MEDFINKIFNEDCLEGLKQLPDNVIDCVITSPPYWGLRDYGEDGQIGLEESPEAYAEKMGDLFDEVRRVLKNDGTLWLNLGDSYLSAKCDYMPTQTLSGGNKRDYIQKDSGYGYPPNRKRQEGLKSKDLVGIPWMVAFEMRKRGWYLRCDIVWHKPNPMPESVKDRPTRAHEFIFLMSKNQKYFYDYEAIQTETKGNEHDKHSRQSRKRFPTDKVNGIRKEGYYPRANKRSVWTETTKPYNEAHFATYPEKLIIDCIKAGCPEYVCKKCGKAREKIIEMETVWRDRPNQYTAYRDINGQPGQRKEASVAKIKGLTDCGCGDGFAPGIVLGPFMGSGTTACVARKLDRNYVGFELNPEYIKIAENRIRNELGMFA